MKKIYLTLIFSFIFVFSFAQDYKTVTVPKKYSKFVYRNINISLDYEPTYTTQAQEELKVFLYALSFLPDTLLMEEDLEYSFTFEFNSKNWDVFLKYLDDKTHSLEFISWASADNQNCSYKQIKIGTELDYVYKRKYNIETKKIEIFDYPTKEYTDSYNYSDILNDYFSLLYEAQKYILNYVDSNKKDLKKIREML